ncbi:MAG TPA: SPOR domain-containing protein [Burkholderiaceae bacterium]|nr:SPOR domain-containing protein [Burkholderiaceae bacterium]
MRFQRGGFVMGLIVGLLLGLGLALAVALYVTKAPVPFVNKVQQRTPEQDAAEAERNKNWDPNAPLANKPSAHASAPASATPSPPLPPPKVPAVAEPPKSTRDPAAILSGNEPPRPIAIAPQSTKPGAEPFIYFVQVGAFSKPEDAEQQRAKLAMLGFMAKVSEREQQGRTVYRVRLGPYQVRDEAESTQAKLQSGGETAALVRVER